MLAQIFSRIRLTVSSLRLWFIRVRFILVEQLSTLPDRFHRWLAGLSETKRRIVTGTLVVVGSICFILINIYMFRYGKDLAKKIQQRVFENIISAPTPTPTPTPIPFPLREKMNFTVSSGKKTGPRMTKCFIDPLDFTLASTQLFGLTVVSEKPVTSVKAVWVSDHREQDVRMSLATGSAINGRWEGKWTVDDTAWYRYLVKMEVSDGNEVSRATLTIR